MKKKTNLNTAVQKTVMVFGAFDYLNDGHIHFLKNAKSLGDYLIVVVARDKTIKQIKGEFPIHNEKQRMKSVKLKTMADKVVLGYHKDKHKVIKKYRPNIVALGYNQYIFTQSLKKIIIDENMDTQIVRLEAYFPQIFKSSIINRSEETESKKVLYNQQIEQNK